MKISIPQITPEGWNPEKRTTKKQNLRLQKLETQSKVMSPLMMINLRRGDHNG